MLSRQIEDTGAWVTRLIQKWTDLIDNTVR